MTDEEWKEVSELLHRTSQISGFMGLGNDDLAQLAQIRERLSFSERACISKFMSIAAGQLWYDAGNVLSAVLELDDQSSKEREERPHVLIRMGDDNNKVHVETIDIIESVKKDAALIGHPAIVWAIKHWERVIHAKQVLLHDAAYSNDEDMNDITEYFQGRDVKIAEQNLKAILKAFQEGIKERAIHAASALALRVKELELDNQHSFLRIAWERLATEHIKPTETVKERIERLKSFLKQSDIQIIGNTNYRVTDLQVMDFLRGAGRKYVGNDKGDGRRISYRPNWKIFQNAFARWYYNVSETIFQDYLTEAKKQGMSEIEYWQPSFSNPKVAVYRLLS